MEAVILAGGKGTRLQNVISDMPKCMAPVAGKPFLSYLLSELETAGFAHVILSLGYRHEVVEKWLMTFPTALRISLAVEDHPLLTGGAVRLALLKATEQNVFVLNGDSFLEVCYTKMLDLHRQTQAKATIALKQMYDFDRYGVVAYDESTHRIIEFKEKKHCDSGFINGGVYLIRKEELRNYPERFSLEKDYFEKIVSTEILIGYRTNGYFIDIGIPEDYSRAQKEFRERKKKYI